LYYTSILVMESIQPKASHVSIVVRTSIYLAVLLLHVAAAGISVIYINELLVLPVTPHPNIRVQ